MEHRVPALLPHIPLVSIIVYQFFEIAWLKEIERARSDNYLNRKWAFFKNDKENLTLMANLFGGDCLYSSAISSSILIVATEPVMAKRTWYLPPSRLIR